LQLEKFAAEDARVTATEKARLAEQERARLVAEGAQTVQQAKAEADAKAAERARLAAEQAKQLAQEQAAAAEQKRLAAETALADRAAADQAAATTPPPAPASDDKTTTMAALTAGSPQADVTKSVQTELRRVGCLAAAADGDWNAASQRSLTLFNRYAGTKLDIKTVSIDTLDAIKLKQSRVCPLICEHGFRADGDRCSRIVCAAGSFLNDDNECEKQRNKKPVAKRDNDDRPSRHERASRSLREPSIPSAENPRPQARARAENGGGQIMCDAHLCRPVRHGCHLEYRGGGGPGLGVGNVEVCN
jgi:hypothetical protein